MTRASAAGKAAEEIIGIDLGTRYALTACLRDGKPEIIPNRWGANRTPSVVAWTPDGYLGGEEALRMEIRDPSRVWWDLKRKIGSSWRGQCGVRPRTAEEILTPLLVLLREDAEAWLGTFVSSCVLTVPAYFSFSERSAIARSGKSAGFRSIRIINEPTAAALAFGRQGRFLVLDFGAGTADISVVESERGVWQVLESTGKSDIGGRDFDLLLASWLAGGIGAPEDDSPFWRMLLSEAERLKIALSDCEQCEWVPFGDYAHHPPVTVSRAVFEHLVKDRISMVVDEVRRLWDRHRPGKLLFVGGSSRIPLLRRMLEERVTRPERLSVCPDEAVVFGAALSTTSGEKLLIDVLSQSLGIIAADETPVPVMEKGTPLPATARRDFTSVGSGPLTLRIAQGDPGSYARWKVIGIQTLRDLAKGESVGLEFRVDGSGLLRIDIIRSDGTVLHIPSVEIGEGATSEERGKMPELKELESRIAVISPKLVPSQRTRIEALSRAVYSLREGEGYGEAITLLDTMVTEMERALKT